MNVDIHRRSKRGAEGASRHHGCIEDVDGEAIRTVAVAGRMFGGRINMLPISSLTIDSHPISFHHHACRIDVIFDVTCTILIHSLLFLHHWIRFSFMHLPFQCYLLVVDEWVREK